MNIDPTKIANVAQKLRKPHVNESCIGCSACTAIAGDVFELDMNGLSIVMPCQDYEGKGVDDAIAACPVNAISWQPVAANDNHASNEGIQKAA